MLKGSVGRERIGLEGQLWGDWEVGGWEVLGACWEQGVLRHSRQLLGMGKSGFKGGLRPVSECARSQVRAQAAVKESLSSIC